MITGGELFELIVQKKNFTEHEAADSIKDILSAVAYCHGMNIVHRDLKPENILVDAGCENCLKIIDFGLSIINK
jgi:serine/threonine protein kinase